MTEILYQSSRSYLYLEYTGSQSWAGDWKGWSRLVLSILRHANHKEVSTQPSCASSWRAAFLLEPKRMQTQGRLTGQEEAGREGEGLLLEALRVHSPAGCQNGCLWWGGGRVAT